MSDPVGARSADVPSFDGLPEDFDRAFLREGMVGAHLTPAERSLLDLVEDRYARHHPATTDPDEAPRIPRILHHIWIGGRALPGNFRRFREGWIDHHPGWEHRLWTDDEVADFDFESRDLYESTHEVGMRTEILRAEILRHFGGLYVDMDYECLRPLDRFHHIYDFYGTLRVILMSRLVLPIVPAALLIDCSLTGAVPGHSVFERFLAKVRRLWKRKERLRLGPWAHLVPARTRRKLDVLHRAAVTTGHPYGSTVRRHLESEDGAERSVILPPSYFNPLDTGWGKARFLAPRYWAGTARHLLRGRWRPKHYVGVQPHTFAVHHAYGSWL